MNTRSPQFDCGVPSLNTYLTDQALADQRAGKSRTLVAVRAGRVVAYFSLAAGSVDVADAPERLAKGQGRQAIPVVLLGRLAVDRGEQGRGLGSRMLLEAAARAAAAAEVIGARALLVQALDETGAELLPQARLRGLTRAPPAPRPAHEGHPQDARGETSG